MQPAQTFLNVPRRPMDVEDYIDVVRRHKVDCRPGLRRAGALGGAGVLLARHVHLDGYHSGGAAAGAGTLHSLQRQLGDDQRINAMLTASRARQPHQSHYTHSL